MEILSELMASISSFIQYFAPGYLFLSSYVFSSYSQREEKTEYLIIKCLSISFVFVSICEVVGIRRVIPQSAVSMGILTTAFLCGLLFGRLYRTNWARRVVKTLFNRSVSEDIYIDLWETATSKDNYVICVKLKLKDDELIYEGQIDQISFLRHDPVILLAYYKSYDKEKVVNDFSKVDNARMIVNHSQIEKFEFAFKNQ
jgi:hypothetical protein